MKEEKNHNLNLMESGVNPYFIIISVVTLVVPLLVLPYVLENAFNLPKTLLMLTAVSLMVSIYCFHFLRGKTVFKSETSTPKILLFLIILNFFSFFYTKNYYFTVIAATMNIVCLIFFYFVSLNIDNKKGFLLFSVTALSGLLVSVVAWLQFFGIFILMKWVEFSPSRPWATVMGTIGNSNYLGAYLIFPLFASIGLIFLMKKTTRLIPVGLFIIIIGAFLFARARASWLGFFLSLPLFFFILIKIHRISILDYFRAHQKQAIIYGLIFIICLVGLFYFAPQRFRSTMGYQKVTESETLRLRMKHLRSSFWLFKQSPLFGTGLWSFRNMVYEAQAEINKTDKDFFKNYPLRETKPRRVHNDYLETLNDGGLLAAAALLLFFGVVMRHGWAVIKDEKIDSNNRIIAATAFCSITAIMITAFFFFPFRINTTMLMTMLMMGIMEGIYLRNYDLISRSGGWKSGMGIFLVPMIFLALFGLLWFTGVKPFLGEVEHFKYKISRAHRNGEKAEKHIIKALHYDPYNSAYHINASDLYMPRGANLKSESKNIYGMKPDPVKALYYSERAIIDFNGDITMWSAYYLNGLLKFKMGNFYEAKAAFEKALYYNPIYEPARKYLERSEKMIRDYVRGFIKRKK